MKSRTISKIIRMTPEEKKKLEYCAEKMGKTETEILIAGVNNYYAAVQSPGSPEKSISLLDKVNHNRYCKHSHGAVLRPRGSSRPERSR